MCFLIQGRLGLWGIYRTSSQTITPSYVYWNNYTNRRSFLWVLVISAAPRTTGLTSPFVIDDKVCPVLRLCSFTCVSFFFLRASFGVDRVCALWGSTGLPEEEPWIKWHLLQRPGYKTTDQSDVTAADEVCLANRWWDELPLIKICEFRHPNLKCNPCIEFIPFVPMDWE